MAYPAVYFYIYICIHIYRYRYIYIHGNTLKIWVAGVNIFQRQHQNFSIVPFHPVPVQYSLEGLLHSVPHRQLASHFDGGWFSDLVSAHHQMAFLEAPENTEQKYAIFAGGAFMPSTCDLV